MAGRVSPERGCSLPQGSRVAAVRQGFRTFFLATFAVAALGGTSAYAADESYHPYEITPFVGYMVGGEFEDPLDSSERDIDEDTNFGIIFNIAADEWRHYEFLYTKQSTSVDGVTPFDIDIDYLQVGGTVSSPDAERVIPYFGMTVGAARFTPDGPGLDDETKLAFSVAGGVKVPITDRIGVRFDARAYITLFDTESDIFCVSSSGAATCRIRAKSDTLLQYSASLGVFVGF